MATIISLDCSSSSSLLSSKMRDVSSKLKFEIITKPLFEFYFGSSKEEIYQNDNKFKQLISLEISQQFLLQFDLVKDKTYLIDQILDLPLEKIQFLANEIGLWRDRSFVLMALEHQIDAMKFANSFTNDREVMMTAVRENSNAVLFASQELLDDYEFIKFSIINGASLRFIPEKFKKDRELVLTAVKVVANNYFSIPDVFKNDKEIVMVALEENPTIFNTLSATRENEKEIIVKTVSKFDILNFDFSGLQSNLLFSNLQRSITQYSLDRNFAIEILSKNGDFFNCFSSEIQNDREIVMEAIKNSRNTIVLDYALEEFAQDKEILRLAVMKNGSALKYAKDLKFDKEIIMEALRSTKGDAFTFVPDELKNDREFLLEMLSTRNCKSQIPTQFINDREIVLEFMKNNGLLLEFASSELKNDKEIVDEAVKNHRNAARFASQPPKGFFNGGFNLNFFTNLYPSYMTELDEEEFNQDFNDELDGEGEGEQHEEIENFGTVSSLSNVDNFRDEKNNLLRLLQYSIHNYVNATERLKNDKEVALTAVNENAECYKYLPIKFKKNREFALTAIKKKDIFGDIPRKLLINDRDIALELVKRNGMNLGLLCYKFRSDRLIISEAIKQNEQAVKFVPYLLR